MKKIVLIVFFAITFVLNGLLPAMASRPVKEQLTKVEREVFGVSYDKENNEERFTRIEKQVFGKTNQNLDEQKRIDKISKALGLETLDEANSSISSLYVEEKEGQNVKYPQIDILEKEILGSNYQNENINLRLERLEKKLFGAKQDGDLASRTDNLKRHATPNITSNSPLTPYIEQIPNYKNNYQYRNDSYSNNNYDNEIQFQLSALENAIFSTDFSSEPVSNRLTRLENKIFQRNFNNDEPQTRISRIQAAATAGKTAKYYDNNKFQKFASTGLQAASFILMILAFIL